MLSTDDSEESRFQIGDGVDTQQIFGVDVEDWPANQAFRFDPNAFGYPKKRLGEVPLGTYWVQALFHRYEVFDRKDGHTVKLPMDRGEGQQWNRAPGNLYSTPKQLHIMRRDWESLGPKLQGKLHIYCGDMDNYYLNNAVYLTEDFLKQTSTPPYQGIVDYGDRAEHCWNGDHNQPNAISRLRYHQMFIPKFEKRMLETAPQGADVTSWRY